MRTQHRTFSGTTEGNAFHGPKRASKSSSAAAESSGDLNTPVIGALTLLAAGGTAAGFSQASAAQAEAEETAKKVAGLEKSLAASDSALDDARQATIEVQEAKAKSDKTLSDALAQAKQEASDLATAKAAEAADLTALAESQRKDLTAKAEAAFAQTAELEVEVQAARAEVEALRTTLAAREEDLDLTKKDLADACASGGYLIANDACLPWQRDSEMCTLKPWLISSAMAVKSH